MQHEMIISSHTSGIPGNQIIAFSWNKVFLWITALMLMNIGGRAFQSIGVERVQWQHWVSWSELVFTLDLTCGGAAETMKLWNRKCVVSQLHYFHCLSPHFIYLCLQICLLFLSLKASMLQVWLVVLFTDIDPNFSALSVFERFKTEQIQIFLHQI